MTESSENQTEAPRNHDPTYFENRYPHPEEILRHGGITGVEYCYVPGSRVKRYADWEDETGNHRKWSTIEGIPPLCFVGPLGAVDTVVLMGRGDPIPGTHDFNGARKFFVDKELEESTGIPAHRESPVFTLWEEEQKRAASAAKGKISKSD